MAGCLEHGDLYLGTAQVHFRAWPLTRLDLPGIYFLVHLRQLCLKRLLCLLSNQPFFSTTFCIRVPGNNSYMSWEPWNCPFEVHLYGLSLLGILCRKL